MYKVSRAKLRGKTLEPYCKKANTTLEDNKIYCYGLYQNNISGTSEDMLEECINCKACVENMPNWKEDFKEVFR